MHRIILISKENLDYAFEEVKNLVQDEKNNPGLHAPFNSALIGKIDSEWSLIKSTIQKAFIFGKEEIKESIDATLKSMNALVQQAGSMANEVHNEILKRLRVFINSLINNAMNLIPLVMTIDQTKFEAIKINFAQKIVLGGSLKANLIEIIALTSSGELELSVEYAKAPIM